MNKKYSLLDCTLRDGAYIVDGKFSNKAINGIITKLQEAGIDIIECGWLKNGDYVSGSSYFHTPEDIKPFLKNKRTDITYVAMMDWDRYDLKQLPYNDGMSIDAIRVVFPFNKYNEAIELAYDIREKGYRVFFQAANTLGYSDIELINMVMKINEVHPEALSIVDTFGAMYEDDLIRIATIVEHNLDEGIKLGLHSHNNLQLSFSLAMSFLNYFSTMNREIVIDSSLVGMGRGAGNACTELLAGFLNKKYGTHYDIDVIMDTVDLYMTFFTNNYAWGYSIPFFLSGSYCAHVNNIAYLKNSHRTSNAQIKKILEKMPREKRTVYDYDLLEREYIDCCLSFRGENTDSVNRLREELRGRNIIIIAPGKNVSTLKKDGFYHNAIKIGVNSVLDNQEYDYLFFTNEMRLKYAYETNSNRLNKYKVIMTSNLEECVSNLQDTYFIDYQALTKFGWVHFDNSVIMCIRMLATLDVNEINIAGFDGYDLNNGYSDELLQSAIKAEEINLLNEEIKEMLTDFLSQNKGVKIAFLTDSLFSESANC